MSLAREDFTTTRRRPRRGELQPEKYFLGVSGQFHELVKRTKNRKIDYVRAEHPLEEPLVAPNSWPSLGPPQTNPLTPPSQPQKLSKMSSVPESVLWHSIQMVAVTAPRELLWPAFR